MRSIKICFTKSRKRFPLFSWVIRGIWSTNYSHVAVVFYSKKYDRELIYHASASGLNFISTKIFNKNHEVVYTKELQVSEEVYSSIIAESIDRSGTSYGTLQAVGVGIAYLLSKQGLPKFNPFSDSRDKWICSEWAAKVLSRIYSDYKPDLETVSPKEVYDFVTKLP